MSDLKKCGPQGSEERAGVESVSSTPNKGNEIAAQPTFDAGAESGVGHFEGDGQEIKFVKG